MIIKQIAAGPILANCYIVSDENKNGFIIDPVYADKSIEDYIEKENIKIKMILLTHTHFDHVLGLEYFKNKYKVDVYASEDAKDIYKNPNYTLTNHFGNVNIIIDKFLKDKEVIKEFNILALKTPGHSVDSMSYLVDEKIFSGDLLFKLSVGRSDFLGGNHGILLKSIMEKLMIYDDSTIVYPGHGELTTIGYERINNPFL